MDVIEVYYGNITIPSNRLAFKEMMERGAISSTIYPMRGYYARTVLSSSRAFGCSICVISDDIGIPS